ncbi:hypothetical protein BH09VER1_BH09VER1_51760 [soil metagenome]
MGIIVLFLIVVVLLLDRASLNTKLSASNASVSQSRNLAEMGLHFVFSQIWDATTTNQTADVSVNSRDTWASQPGAIWRFGSTGGVSQIYKLYSVAPVSGMKTTNSDLAADVPADWFSRKKEYTDLNEPVDVGGIKHYAILDPSILATASGAKGISEGFAISSAAPVASGTGANTAPMPVQWIYLLQDGTPCQLGDTRVSKANPIVGRVAFWTDDESSKVNINTASPATDISYWDVPRAYSTSERNLGLTQPAQNEYQRYPGHPAMVSLRPILGDLGSLAPVDYYNLAPRYRWGGSEDGAKQVSDSRTSLLTNKGDRLYSSIDEMLFTSMDRARTPVTTQQAEQLKFFLTANSRAPELNLFGQPRVCIWPIHNQDSDTRRTPYDRLIAFCSTIGGLPYYFTRESPWDSTHDYDSIPRNQALYAYLQRLTGAPIPGFGGNFASKYGVDRDQVLTEIFDYIRTVNLNETYKGRDANFLSYTSDWKISVPSGDAQSALTFSGAYTDTAAVRGAGMVVPIEIGTTRGMGRFPVVSELGIWFVKHYDVNSLFSSGPELSKKKQLEAMLVIETTTPAFGYMPWCGRDLQFQVVSSNVQVKVGANQVNLFAPGTTPIISYPPLLNGGVTMGGYDGGAYTSGKDTGNMALYYPFFSSPIDLVSSDTKFSIISGTVNLNVLVGGKIVQTYKMQFPDATNLPMPVIDTRDATYSYGPVKHWWRSRGVTDDPFMPWDQDVLRSVELSHGDARLVAANHDVAKELFTPHQRYSTTDRLAHGLRGENNGYAFLWTGGTAGTYVNLPYFTKPFHESGEDSHRSTTYTTQPKIPSTITSLRDAGWSGDFDNGLGVFPDGPFINKPDEGMLDTSNANVLKGVEPYSSAIWSIGDGLFSPLRQVPSAVMFGSLPTGAKAGIPWRTLLFCPNPADPNHVGFNAPADHLLLDLFTMPIVEPYAISEPFSTAGKINMNYAVAPFSYIRRASSLYAALGNLQIFSIPDSKSAVYKTATADVYRAKIDVAETLKQFDQRFASNAIFKSASEICRLFLVPQGSSLSNVSDLASGYWSTHRLTGDNSREKPYAELYPKLTTQSNTYRVHVRAQVLPPTSQTPTTDDFKVVSEYRGSWVIERYLNSNDSRISKSANDPDSVCLNQFYKFRVLQTQQFNP